MITCVNQKVLRLKGNAGFGLKNGPNLLAAESSDPSRI
jgi:hypothetical protein